MQGDSSLNEAVRVWLSGLPRTDLRPDAPRKRRRQDVFPSPPASLDDLVRRDRGQPQQPTMNRARVPDGEAARDDDNDDDNAITPTPATKKPCLLSDSSRPPVFDSSLLLRGQQQQQQLQQAPAAQTEPDDDEGDEDSRSAVMTATTSASDTSTNTTGAAGKAPRSRASSPRKRKMHLATLPPDEAIAFKALVYDQMSPQIQAFLEPIYRVSAGSPFIPPSYRARMVEAAAADATSSGPGGGNGGNGNPDDDDDDDGESERPQAVLAQYLRPVFMLDCLVQRNDHPSACPPFRFPDPLAVADIVARAKRLQDMYHEETQWNHGIHSRVLSCLFLPIDDPVRAKSLVRHSYCTTALPYSRPQKTQAGGQAMVDLTLYVDPGAVRPPELQALVQERIAQVCHANALTRTVNHTDFPPLGTKPLCVGIESKRSAGDTDKADVQLGIWLSAHWRFLAHLLGGKSRHKRSGGAGSGTLADAAAANRKLAQELVFLPGLIVEGHRWSLVVSVLDPQGTVTIYNGMQIGSTDNALNVYKLLFALRILEKWATETYWPWFARSILGICL
ncbi:uncharacterized protein MKZ38_001365 [Zalerion maritima]|uniref:PD-(D/E)XK nuclease-like domain-containing protein n=1 Tax=Zalerion maritima TaxID=339359 RepID=A0AAD5RRU9_9PEZI|nr:uncharacterized protein MKZ38_001365 [Zalerion maritima]